MDPTISVIVPVYNASQFIDKCINSILAQSFSGFELLLIDDGSTDESFQICKRFAALDSRIKCFHKSNGGHMDALRYGLTKAHGQWLSFCDHDDSFPSNALETLLNLTEDDINIVVGFSYSGDGSCYQISPEEWRRMMIHGDIIFCTRWAKLYRRSLFNDSTCITDSSVIVGEDMLMNIKVAFANDMPIKVINTKAYNYLQITTSQSILYKWTPEKYFNLYSNLSETMLQVGADLSYREALVQNIIGMLHDLRLHFSPIKIRLSHSELQMAAKREVLSAGYKPTFGESMLIFHPDLLCVYFWLNATRYATILCQFFKRIWDR